LGESGGTKLFANFEQTSDEKGEKHGLLPNACVLSFWRSGGLPESGDELLRIDNAQHQVIAGACWNVDNLVSSDKGKSLLPISEFEPSCRIVRQPYAV